MPPPALDERLLRVPGTRNLRDVGGYPAGDGRVTRWRTLLRADALDRLPAASQRALLELGLRQVIDLRWPHELAGWPSVFSRSDRVTYRPILLLEDDPAGRLGLAGTYRHVLDTRGEQLVGVARALIAPGGVPAVIGCAAGKDRTGIVIATLLAAVGVPTDVVIGDYALSAAAFARDVADDVFLDDWRRGPVAVDCDPAWMAEALDHLERRHGGARALLGRHGLTADELAGLEDVLTQPA